MIKKYNQFVKENINEDFQFGGEPATEPTTIPAPTTTPTEEPGPAPSKPGPFKRERKSPVPAPAKAQRPTTIEEEEVGEYKGTQMMNDLANKLGVEIKVDGSIDYEGKKINFYSETECFHIDKEKIDTVEGVLDYLNTGNSTEVENDEEVNIDENPEEFEDEGNELPGEINDEEEIDLDDEIDNLDQFTESKSYRLSRKFKDFK